MRINTAMMWSRFVELTQSQSVLGSFCENEIGGERLDLIIRLQQLQRPCRRRWVWSFLAYQRMS